MQGRLKRRTLNELADRDRPSNWNDLRHISSGSPSFCSLDGPPPIGRNANFAVVLGGPGVTDGASLAPARGQTPTSSYFPFAWVKGPFRRQREPR
jgi:hypothetical protein